MQVRVHEKLIISLSHLSIYLLDEAIRFTYLFAGTYLSSAFYYISSEKRVVYTQRVAFCRCGGYVCTVVHTHSVISGSLVVTAWRFLSLRMKERPPLWRVAANILNKQSRTADKGSQP